MRARKFSRHPAIREIASKNNALGIPLAVRRAGPRVRIAGLFIRGAQYPRASSGQLR
jgi:hypothetical protein